MGTKMKLYIALVLLNSWPGDGLFHERSSTTFTSPYNNSYFGFSMTYEVMNKRLIVGAPQGLNKGLVFSCGIEDQDCMDIPIKRSEFASFTHNYWMGATLKSDEEYFYTCAPRSMSVYNNDDDKLEKLGSGGKCYKISDANYTQMVKLSNIDDRSRYLDVTKYGQASDTFGWSLDIGTRGDFIVGGPGLFTGRVKAKHGRTVIGLTGVRPKIHLNFGYSVVMSNLNDADPTKISYGIGSPYGILGFGQVLVYDASGLTVLYKLESNSDGVGTMFGAVLCAAHMSGPEEAATLLVGAPTHAVGFSVYDVGAVYVYLKSTQIRIIQGVQSGGHFGLTIANLGDLNGDQRDEVAIAAPYEMDGRGTVYVYCGAHVMTDDVTITPLQRLEPLSLVRGFGLGLASLNDYDDNGCNELAIGAPFSDSVSLLRCLASIVLEVDAHFPDLKNSTHFEFQSCVKVTYPDKPNVIIGSVNVTLKIFHPHAALADPSDSHYVVPLEDKTTPVKCRNVKLLIPQVSNNSTTYLRWEITASQSESTLHMLERKEFEPSRVMISDQSVLKRSGTESVYACTEGCDPILRLTIRTVIPNNETNPYLIGSGDSMAIFIEVINEGSRAFDSCIRLHAEGAALAGYMAGCTRHYDTYTCKPPGSLGNQETWRSNGDIQLDMRKVTSEHKVLRIFAYLHSNCDSSNRTEYIHNVYLKTDSKTINLKGRPNPEVIKMRKEEMYYIGKNVEHVYTITNFGITNWANIYFSITYEMAPFISQQIEDAFRDSVDYSTPVVNVSRTTDQVTITCVIRSLPKSRKVDIIVPIHIIPEGLDKLWKHENETINTSITLNLDGEVRKYWVNSTLMSGVPNVPLFIIIAAVCLGLLLVGILTWALYECGFLKRKNKENLELLKKDVRRQSMRKSMMAELRARQQSSTEMETEPVCILGTMGVKFSDLNNSTDALIDTHNTHLALAE